MRQQKRYDGTLRPPARQNSVPPPDPDERSDEGSRAAGTEQARSRGVLASQKKVCGVQLNAPRARPPQKRALAFRRDQTIRPAPLLWIRPPTHTHFTALTDLRDDRKAAAHLDYLACRFHGYALCVYRNICQQIYCDFRFYCFGVLAVIMPAHD